MKIKKIKTRKPALKSLVLLLPAVFAITAFTVQTDLSVERKSELLYILEQDCGSCHGLTMKGGLGPALMPERLQHLNDAELTSVILDGVPGTPMPPWRPLLTEQEAQWLTQVIRSGDRVR